MTARARSRSWRGPGSSMARASCIDRVQPNRMRSKLISWPFPVDDGETPKVRLKVLGAHELEAAHLATADYFKGLKSKVATTDGAFIALSASEVDEMRAASFTARNMAADSMGVSTSAWMEPSSMS